MASSVVSITVVPGARDLNSTLSFNFPHFAHVASLPSFQQWHSSTSLLPFRWCGSVPGFPPHLGTRCQRGFPAAGAGQRDSPGFRSGAGCSAASPSAASAPPMRAHGAELRLLQEPAL